MATIDGLFEQIIHSEKAAQQTKNKIQELRQEVFANQENCRTLEQKNCELQQLLKTKLDELSRHELTAKWLASREKIYVDQKAELDMEMQRLVEKQRLVAEWFCVEREKLCAQISQYSQQYGAGMGNGTEDRLKHYRQRLDELLSETKSLETDLEKFLKEEAVVIKFGEEKEDVRNKLVKAQEVITELRSELSDEVEKSASLENQCQALSEEIQSDPQYISLVVELDKCKQQSAELDVEHARLQEELNQLHQQLWQQQLQQQQTRKQQQQHQQQQRDCVVQTSQCRLGPLESSTSGSQKPVGVESNADEYSCDNMEDLFSDAEDLDLDPDKGQGESDRGQGDSTVKGHGDFQTASDVMQTNILVKRSMDPSNVTRNHQQQDDNTCGSEKEKAPSSQMSPLPLTMKIFRSSSKNIKTV